MMSINGTTYQAYCVEYSNSAPNSYSDYNFDTTPENVDAQVSACLNGVGTYGVTNTQRAIWYFTDGINPSSSSNAWHIINNVNNGNYAPTCASEWNPVNSNFQDMCTGDDPYCTTICQPNLTINNNGLCDIDIYLWETSGDVYQTTIAPGGSWSIDAEEDDMFRATSSPTDWQNLEFDESYTVTDNCYQTWDLDPVYCLPDSWEYGCDDNVCVEIIGSGIKYNLPKTLNIPNSGNVTQIIAEATWDGSNAPSQITFSTGSQSVNASRIPNG